MTGLLYVFLLLAGQIHTLLPRLCNVILPDLELRHEAGKESSFMLQCENRLWERSGGEVMVALDPGVSTGLRICVQSTAGCVLSSELVRLNMTQHSQNYTVRVEATDVGVRCISETSVYMRGSQLFPADIMEESSLELVHNMTGFFDSEPPGLQIPDLYTEVIVIEQEQDREVERNDEDVMGVERVPPAELQLAIITDSKIDLSYKKIREDQSLWQEVDVYTKSPESITETMGSYFSRILVMLALAAANFMIGTGIDWRAVTSLIAGLRSSCRQCSCLTRFLSMQAWKVGLLGQVCYPPLISFALGKLVFRPDLQCRSVVDLSRLGLFLIGTVPGNTTATYFAALWNGDLQLSVSLVILSTLLSPLTSLLWWHTLGKILLSSATSDVLTVPISNILEFIAIMIIPIFIGIYMAGKFPTLKTFMEQIRKPIIAIGMCGCIVIFYFQYKHFFSIFSLSHVVACGILAFSSGSLAGLTAYFCRLERSEILSIVIDCCMQNGTLSYAVISGTLENPSSFYAEIPANAQILFTSVPILLSWLMYQGSWRFWTFLQTSSKSRHWRTCQTDVVAAADVERSDNMVRISDIKEAWTDQHNLSPLWC